MISSAGLRLPQSALRFLFRHYSGALNVDKLHTFHHKDLSIVRVKPEERRPQPKADEPLGFGSFFADHMLEMDWDIEKGWTSPEIHPYENLSLDPSCKVFHYAIEIFEGMKAYRGVDNRIRLFRPELNMERMRRGAIRSALPDFDGTELLRCIKELVRLDQDWIPHAKGTSLYIRPTMIGTEKSLSVRHSNSAKLFVITGPVGAYFNTFHPISLLADAQFVRATEGGVGAYKMGCNYAPTVKVSEEAEKECCEQVLWLNGPDHRVSEAGAMNVFMHWKNEKGEEELITPSLHSGVILPGVTRQSILDLAHEMGNLKVTEGDFNMSQVLRASKEKRIYEFFGAGTAVVISPVNKIVYRVDGRQEVIELPVLNEEKTLTRRLFKKIDDIQHGRESRPEWTEEI